MNNTKPMTSATEIQKKYMKDPSLQEGDVLDSRIIYVPETDLFQTLNLSALLVWTLLDRQGAFDSRATARAYRDYATWFDPEPPQETIEQDIDSILNDFINKKLLISKPDEIRIAYSASPLHVTNKGSYSSPKITEYDSEWMKENHPQYFHVITYSDIWNPAQP